jgi:GDPmannose 4,6-dehydratase
MTDANQLNHVLSIVKPDVIVHLASISSSKYAFDNPLEALTSNGMLTAHLCDIIHKKGWNTKLFNASSSEIYKGHNDYEVKEDDHNMFHLHPYSIAKTMGHSIVEFYRNNYGLPFSNGVIFTTESRLKRPDFLLNKVAKHIREAKYIREWKEGNKIALHVGNLDSYRTILHASDVANAIHTIVSQEKGDTYLICNDESYLVYDVVLKLFEIAEIDVVKKDNILYEKDSDLQLLVIQDTQLGFDSTPTNIRGESKKLKMIGWNATLSIDDILKELL